MNSEWIIFTLCTLSFKSPFCIGTGNYWRISWRKAQKSNEASFWKEKTNKIFLRASFAFCSTSFSFPSPDYPPPCPIFPLSRLNCLFARTAHRVRETVERGQSQSVSKDWVWCDASQEGEEPRREGGEARTKKFWANFLYVLRVELYGGVFWARETIKDVLQQQVCLICPRYGVVSRTSRFENNAGRFNAMKTIFHHQPKKTFPNKCYIPNVWEKKPPF